MNPKSAATATALWDRPLPDRYRPVAPEWSCSRSPARNRSTPSTSTSRALCPSMPGERDPRFVLTAETPASRVAGLWRSVNL